MVKFRLMLALLMVAGLVAACVPAAAPGAPIVIKLHDPFQPRTSAKAMTWFMEEVEKRSAGRVKFELTWGGALGTLEEQTENIRSGVFDAGFTSCVYEPGKYPLSTVGLLPLLMSNYRVSAYAGQELLKHPAIVKEVEQFNQKALFMQATDVLDLVGTKSVSTLEELRKQKVRAHGGAADALKEMGVPIVAVPAPELYTALERKTVDLAAWPVPTSFVDWKYHEVAKFWNDTGGFFYFVYYFSINLDKWKGLPADIQKLMLEVADQAAGAGADALETDGKVALKTMEAAGVKRIKWSDAEKARIKKEGGTPVWEKWVKDMEAKKLPGREVFNHFKGLVDKYEAKYKTP